MEKTLYRRRVGAIAVALAMAASPQAIGGGGGALTGGVLGATEVTQLANNAELVASYLKEVETALHTLETALATIENLKQLPAAIVGKILGPHLSQMKNLGRLYGKLSSIYKRVKGLQGSFDRVINKAKNLNLSPEELLRVNIEAIMKYGGAIRERYENEVQNVKELQQEIKEFNDSQEFGSIKTTIGGLQNLAAQNVAMYNMLGRVNTQLSIIHAQTLEKLAREQQAIEASAHANDQYEEIRKKLIEEMKREVETKTQ